MKELNREEMLKVEGGAHGRPIDDGFAPSGANLNPSTSETEKGNKQREEAMKKDAERVMAVIDNASVIVNLITTISNLSVGGKPARGPAGCAAR